MEEGPFGVFGGFTVGEKQGKFLEGSKECSSKGFIQSDSYPNSFHLGEY